MSRIISERELFCLGNALLFVDESNGNQYIGRLVILTFFSCISGFGGNVVREVVRMSSTWYVYDFKTLIRELESDE